MVKKDPLDQLASLADQRLQPDHGFATRLFAELVADIDGRLPSPESALTVLELNEEEDMRETKSKSFWLIAVAAGLVAITVGVAVLLNNGGNGTTVTDQPTAPDTGVPDDAQPEDEATTTTEAGSTTSIVVEAPSNDELESVANEFLDAFYSGDSEVFVGLFTDGALVETMRYYQGWAQGAGYQEVERSCEATGQVSSVRRSYGVSCMTRFDDRVTSVLGYQTTDTFNLKVVDGKVDVATFASNDPPVWNDFAGWLRSDRPEIMSGPCEGHLVAGKTPSECALAMEAAANEFVLTDDYTAP